MSFHRRILLTVLWTGVALIASPLARAQDAPSATLKGSSKTAGATPTPSPEGPTSVPSLEISAKTPSQTPAPAAEQTPGAEEPAIPAANAEKKTGVKRHATFAAKRKAAEPPAADLTSLSSAKAVAVSAPLPQYPYQAKRANITGSGICVILVDPASGKVTSAIMEQSTGNAILDKVTTNAFRTWRFKPGTVSQVRVPITYE